MVRWLSNCKLSIFFCELHVTTSTRSDAIMEYQGYHSVRDYAKYDEETAPKVKPAQGRRPPVMPQGRIVAPADMRHSRRLACEATIK